MSESEINEIRNTPVYSEKFNKLLLKHGAAALIGKAIKVKVAHADMAGATLEVTVTDEKGDELCSMVSAYVMRGCDMTLLSLNQPFNINIRQR